MTQLTEIGGFERNDALLFPAPALTYAVATMMTTALVGLLLLAGAGWVWYDSMRALERAREAGRMRCAEVGVVLLDDTVVLTRLRPMRDAEWRWTLYREYQFEFTGDGVTRYGGEITLIGDQVQDLVMEPYREG